MKNFYYVLCITLGVNAEQAYASESGMPQLNSEFWIGQIFWLVIIFSILYLIIWKIFLPKITSSIENRKFRMVNDLNEAERLKENAEKKLKEYNKIIDDAKREAKKIFENSKKKLDEDISNKRKKFNEEIEKELLVTEKEILELKKSSISNISKIATDISADVIKQIIDTEVNKSNVTAIVEDLVKQKTENHA